MSDGLFSRHAALNAGAIPVSAEELSQRYAKLFQQYSRLKAQHAVLKKAVIKEQASNIALQGNVKEKEKELRKLQEQLDLLSFHNERLIKRIQAVQESEHKASYFSLLGGSAKKELEKNAQALDAANSDLERKIQENEQLHDELTEKQFEFTANINTLLKQIQELESRVEELESQKVQSEDPTLQESDSQEPNAEESNAEESNAEELSAEKPKESLLSKEEEEKLKQKIEYLKSELTEKTQLLREQEERSNENDARLLSEIRSLRAVLVLKMGNTEDESLEDILPEAQKALRDLEKEAENYIQSNRDTKPLPYEIAERLVISHETWRSELANVMDELENKKRELNDSLKRAQQDQEDQYNDQIRDIQERHQQENKQLEQEHEEMIKQLDVQHKEQLDNQESAKEEIAKKFEQLETMNSTLNQENAKLQQEIEELKNKQSVIDNETQTEGEDVFIYPKEEEEEAFVYTGVDALPTEDQKMAELKASYENQVNELTKQLQMSDSKALRLAEMYNQSQEQLLSDEEVKQSMILEIERLNKQVKHVQDMLTTTESNYQKQVDAMTEMITSLQSN